MAVRVADGARAPVAAALCALAGGVAVAGGGSGCSAAPLPTDLAAAEAAERSGDEDAALAAYTAATESCWSIEAPSRRRQMCADAHVRRAEVLERMGRDRDAAAAYAALPEQLGDPAPAATGLYRAGRLYLALGEDRRGYDLLWRAIADYPDEAFAGDALRLVVRDGRRRNADQLYGVLGELLGALSGSGVADNLLYWLADIAEHEQADRERARNHHDRIADEYPKSGLRDEALWHGARLSRAIGDPRGAVTRLRALLATREVAFGAGSYFSIWLDNAQLELGRVLRDDLADLPAARRAFAALPRLYPASVLRDDASWELAVTWERAGDAERACAELARLTERWPESRHALPAGAPAMRARLACPAAGR